MNPLRIAALAGLVAALAGCGVLRDMEAGSAEPWVKPDTPRPASDLDSLLLYFQHIKKLSGAELGREHDNARQAYARTRSELNRVRLAMMLSLPNTAFNDEPRALELLDPVVKNPQTSLHGLAFLLAAYIQEQKRLDGNVQNLQQNLHGLQQKLDALKSLERSLTEREQGGARKK